MNDDKQILLRLFSKPDDYNDLIEALDIAYLDLEGDRKNGEEDSDLLAKVTYWLDELQGPDGE